MPNRVRKHAQIVRIYYIPKRKLIAICWNAIVEYHLAGRHVPKGMSSEQIKGIFNPKPTYSETNYTLIINKDFYFCFMSTAFRIYDQYRPHFVTFTVHQWVDVFSRRIYADIFLESIRFCQQTKGLKVFGWVIMSNHVHLIIGSSSVKLSDIIRDIKKYTGSQIVKAIEANPQESRKKWMLWLFKKENGIWFWEEGYHGEIISTLPFFESKLNYIHQNPVRAGIVEKEEEYIYSSSCDYFGNRKGLLELDEL